MNKQKPCSEWQEYLAARHQEDISPATRVALNAHLAVCSACARTDADYQLLTERIRALPEPVALPLPQLGPYFQPEESSIAIPIGSSSRSRTFIAHRSRFVHHANTLAAVLIVVFVSIATLLLFAHHPMTTSSFTRTISSPSHYNCLGSYLGVLPGLDNICTQHLYTSPNIMKQIGRYQITLERAYADANLIVIQVAVKAPDTRCVFLSSPTLKAQQSLRFLPIDSAYCNDPPSTTQTQFLSFDAGNIPVTTQWLHFQLEARSLALLQKEANASSVSGPLSFDFTVPFHPGRILNVHHTLTVNGTSITLERVVVTMSETRFFLQSTSTSSDDTFDLSIGSWHAPIVLFSAGPASSPLYNVSFILHPSFYLFDKHGEWTLRVKDAHINNGSWLFHFTMP